MKMAGLILLLMILSSSLLYSDVNALSSEDKERSPNIVFIMADDLGVGEIGFLPGGRSKEGRPLSTPNIDTYFGKEGMVFAHGAYSGYTVCAPSRTTFFTGFHSGNFLRNGLDGTTLSSAQGVVTFPMLLQKAGYSTAGIGKLAPLQDPLNLGFDHFFGQIKQGDCHNMYPPTLDSGNGTCNVYLPLNNVSGKRPNRSNCMERPEAYNYTTDMFTENALRWLRATVGQRRNVGKRGVVTIENGYDGYKRREESGDIHNNMNRNDKNKNKKEKEVERGGERERERDILLDHRHHYRHGKEREEEREDTAESEGTRHRDDKTKREKKRDRESDVHSLSPPQPFFLYLSYTVPHAGGWTTENEEAGAPVPDDLSFANESLRWPVVEMDHAAQMLDLDSRVGVIIKELKRLGVENETLVMFASDNGAHNEGFHNVSFFNSTAGLRGYKRSLYEGGVRSPTMVRWPGMIEGGRRSDLRWAFWDIMPTFAELAGIEPSTLPRNIDGRSIVPQLLQHENAPRQVHSLLYHTWGGGSSPPSSGLHNLSASRVREREREKERGWPRRVKERGNAAAGVKAKGYAVVDPINGWKGVVHNCSDYVNLTPSNDDVMELYDISYSDLPTETRDISKDYPDVVEVLRKLVVGKNFTCIYVYITPESSVFKERVSSRNKVWVTMSSDVILIESGTLTRSPVEEQWHDAQYCTRDEDHPSCSSDSTF